MAFTAILDTSPADAPESIWRIEESTIAEIRDGELGLFNPEISNTRASDQGRSTRSSGNRPETHPSWAPPGPPHSKGNVQRSTAAASAAEVTVSAEGSSAPQREKPDPIDQRVGSDGWRDSEPLEEYRER